MDDFDMGLLDDKTYLVAVLRQKMLGMYPVFMYRTKPKIEGEEYLADEWNLRKPLKECSLRIERRGELLLIVFTYKNPGSPPALFAVSKVDISSERNMDYYIKPVGDSSRYFAIRVTDQHGEREAVVGLGFREREEAADFNQCIINFQNAFARERLGKAGEMAHQE
eukprot:CAMPEP_0198143726 /NCGR_PEP_ID=MMETSP1443-20131203/9956_1 /TAXON_ID=186043 /ORGANISM="Entomoneis sp., Strain CCMP2396" /LENGTH=165 /DNA_ID=CAMNT_0043807007 /DNA_START=113 /DNA_END=613 /DNA_ORIENTATION=+